MAETTNMAINTGKMRRFGRMALAALMVSTVCAGTTAPDAGGYTGTDAAAYSFIDLTVSGGSASVLANQDDAVALLTLPFSFVFYGTAYTQLCVSSNGLAYFVTGSPACAAIGDFQNVDLTSAGTSGNLPAVIPYWTDLVLQGGGAVYYQTQGAVGSRKFVLQWNNAYPQATALSANPVTFELVLYETSNQILFQYKTVNLGSANPASQGAQATVGIRDASGNTNGRETQWSYNAAVLNDSSAILFAIGPVLTVAKTHNGNFNLGQTNATYTVTVSNAGGGPTSGTVTATESVPAGLTLQSMAGTGWTCPGTAANNCTRGDALAAGASYPTITVTVSVAANATSPQVNSISVSGGGSSTATTTDSTVITTVAPQLSIAKTHTGTFVQGQTNATYTVTVSNASGAGPTSGTVTMTETVPSGLNLLSMAGTGWTCPGTAANNCTRSDSLAAGSSYPTITVTVNVASTATSPQVNSVSASGGGSASANTTDSTAIVGVGSLRFVPLPPCRVVDTRHTNGPFGGPSIAGNTSRDFSISNGACGVPPTAQAYSLNVTAVPPSGLGFLTIWPTGQTRPVASTLNSVDGRVKANAAIVPAGTGGAVSVYGSNTSDVVLDINGYFIPATDSTALAFYPLTPCRLVDTRKQPPAVPIGGPSLVGQQSRTFAIAGICNLPPTAQAYSLNFAAVPPGALGFLTVFPTGQTRPTVSTLNDVTGTVVANAAIVPAGTSGSIDVYASNNTDVVIDINGYFAPMNTGGLSLYGVTPCRVLNTRQPPGSPPITSLDVNVTASGCAIPATAQAYVFNVTVVPPSALGFLTLWPQGQTRPTVSTLNAIDGAVTSNMAIVPTTNGSISAFASNLTHLVLDILGYFGQ